MSGTDPYGAGDPFDPGGVLSTPPNITCLSQGYNVLVTDPFDINKTSPSIPVFDMKSSSEMVPGTNWGRMPGVTFRRMASGSQSSQSILMKTAAEFQQTSSEHVEFEIGKPDVFNASSSLTFSHFREDKSSRENFVCFSRATRLSYQAHLDLTNVELDINPEFLRTAQALPGSYDYSAYEQFLKAIGTHYVSQIDMGGMVYMSKVVTTDVYSKLTREGVDFQAAANGVFDAVKAGGKVEIKDQKQLLFQSEVKVEKTDLRYIGGEMNPSADNSFVGWSGSVDTNPQPINVKVRPIEELFEPRYLGRHPATPGEEPEAGAALWSAKRANLHQAMVEYLNKNGIRYIDYLKYALPVYQYAGGRTVPEHPGAIRSLGLRMGFVPPIGPRGASWEPTDYICMAFKEPTADCVPVDEYRNPATEGYRYRSHESPGPEWEKVRTAFYAPKTATNYSHAIHAWGFDNVPEASYQAKGDSPPMGTYYQIKELPGGGTSVSTEQRPMEDHGLVFYGVSSQIAASS